MKSLFSKVFEKITWPATFLRVVKFGGFGEITKEVDEFSSAQYLFRTPSRLEVGSGGNQQEETENLTCNNISLSYCCLSPVLEP